MPTLVGRSRAELEIMAARDKYHDSVRNALIKDGWKITHDPYRVTIGRRRGYLFFDPQHERITEWIETTHTEPL